MPTQLDLRQSVLRAALGMVGSSAGDTADTLFPKINDELAKLFEDRNVMLQNGGIITFTGTQIQFTENLEIAVNQKISGAAPQVVSLGMANVNLANNEMWYAVVNRTAGTASTSIATSLPASVAANQEIFLIAKRVDAGDGTQRVYWRNGMALNAGQSVRLGASGSGSGGGTGDDINSLLFRASFTDAFDEGPSDSKSAVDVTSAHTDPAAYNAAKSMYTLNYDASKTIAAATTTTNINISANASFTVKTGDMVISGLQARRITAVANQASFTVEAFDVAPTLASQVTISQAVHTKDIYNLPVDGNALSAAFSGATFAAIMTDYEDTTAAGDNIFDVNTAPVVAYDASHNGTSWTGVKIRPTLETDQVQEVLLNASGTGLYQRFYAYKTSGSGIVNLLRYKSFMQKLVSATTGGITNSAYAFTNNVGTPINCAVSVVGGKTTVTLNWQYAVGVLAGTTASSIEVWLNGAKLPRFVDVTLTPDGSFLETSSNIITLDKDYSSLNLSVEVYQRTQIIDSNTQNTTNIALLAVNQGRNYLINGAFDLWQRATTNTIANAASTYVADRWYVKNSLGTNGVITCSQVAGIVAGSKYGASVQITTAPTAAQTNGTELYQVIENAMTLDLIGQVISFSANVKALGLVNQIGLQFCYATTETKPSLFFGTEQLVTVNTSSFSLGSLLAQSSGSLPTSSGVIGVRIRITGVSSGNLYALNNGFIVEQAEVNIGSSAMAFSRAGRFIQGEVAMCQRFFEKSYDLATAVGTSTTLGCEQYLTRGNNAEQQSWGFRVNKRATPTMAFQDPSSGSATQVDRARNVTDNTQVFLQPENTGQRGFGTQTASVVAKLIRFNWYADAEI